MSNNLTITVGGEVRHFSGVNKLGAVLQGGGESLWVNKREQQVDHITGRDTDGEIYDVYRGTDGGIKKIPLPSEIRVTILPRKTIYTDGELFDLSGIEVKAYLASGELWTDSTHPGGVIPLSELSWQPTVAEAAEVHTKELNGQSVSYINSRGVRQPNWIYGYDYGTILTDGCLIKNINGYIAAFSLYDRLVYIAHPWDSSKQPYEYYTDLPAHVVVDGGQTVYYNIAIGDLLDGYPPQTNINDYQLIANILYGENSTAIGDTPIEVSWSRPHDGEILSTSFMVVVYEAPVLL